MVLAIYTCHEGSYNNQFVLWKQAIQIKGTANCINQASDCSVHSCGFCLATATTINLQPAYIGFRLSECHGLSKDQTRIQNSYLHVSDRKGRTATPVPRLFYTRLPLYRDCFIPDYPCTETVYTRLLLYRDCFIPDYPCTETVLYQTTPVPRLFYTRLSIDTV